MHKTVRLTLTHNPNPNDTKTCLSRMGHEPPTPTWVRADHSLCPLGHDTPAANFVSKPYIYIDTVSVAIDNSFTTALVNNATVYTAALDLFLLKQTKITSLAGSRVSSTLAIFTVNRVNNTAHSVHFHRGYNLYVKFKYRSP